MRSIVKASSTSRPATRAPSPWSFSPLSCSSRSSSSGSWNRGCTTDESPTLPRAGRRSGLAALRRVAGPDPLLLDAVALLQDARGDLLAEHSSFSRATAVGQLPGRLRAHHAPALSLERGDRLRRYPLLSDPLRLALRLCAGTAEVPRPPPVLRAGSGGPAGALPCHGHSHFSGPRRAAAVQHLRVPVPHLFRLGVRCLPFSSGDRHHAGRTFCSGQDRWPLGERHCLAHRPAAGHASRDRLCDLLRGCTLE